LSGMIMIDFINMKQKGAESALLDYMRELTDADPVYVKVLDITPLGIMELTRRRIRRPFR
ncbi:MAG: ribonuclease E/G, partial [Lachnospiraceae bacterium]|nr:ribonuclease E/G [Lachnospiraceae bacterium]